MQSTPLSKATCAATHSRIHIEEEEEKKKTSGTWHKQSILVLVILIVQFPLLFFFGTMTHGRVLSFKT